MPAFLSARYACVYAERMSDTVLLTPQHKKFADEYLVTQNASEAARRAGYSAKNPGVQGSKLLARADIKQYLATRVAELSTQVTETADDLAARVIEELKLGAFSTIENFIRIDDDGKPQIDFSAATPEQLRAITSVKSKTSRKYNGKGEHIATDSEAAFTLRDKDRSLEMLGRHLGLFKSDEQRVVIDVADRLLAARRRMRELGDSGAGGG
jgi:phage terminase small subunit